MRYLGILAALVLVLAGAWWIHVRRDAVITGSAAESTPAGRAPAPEPLAEPARSTPASSVPVPAGSAPRPGVIRGSVTDEHGAPLHEVLVAALDAAGEDVFLTGVDASGAFTLSALDPRAARIEPRKEGWFARESPALAGLCDGVRLVLERGGRIEGSLLLDPERGSLGAHVRVTGAGDGARRRLGEIHADGSFGIEGLDSGEYVFELAGDGEGMPVGDLFHISGVEVRRSQTTRDPRLQALALEALVRSVQLTVEDPAGALVQGATVHVLEREGGVLARASMKREVLSLPVPADRLVDALVVHAGFRPALVTLDMPYARVVLTHGIQVFLRPTQPLQLDRGSVFASMRLRPELPGIENWPEGVCDVELPMSLGSEPLTEVVFPFAGHYRLHVTLLERTSDVLVSSPGGRFVIDEGFDVFEIDAGKRRDFWLPPDLFEQIGPAAAGR